MTTKADFINFMAAKDDFDRQVEKLVEIISMHYYKIYRSPYNIGYELSDDKEHIIIAAKDYMGWVLLIPLTGFVAFLYDGILIGMTESAIMRNAIFIATALFFVFFFTLSPFFANSALWIAFITYLLGRSVLMAVFSRNLIFNNKL